MYEKVLEKQTQVLKALAHPKRLEIIALLAQQELSVSAIYSMLDLPQANSSQHLAILKNAGLLAVKKIGKECHYSLMNESVFDLYTQVKTFSIESLAADQLQDSAEVVDPVCGMKFPASSALFIKKYQEITYYFCASGCLKQFSQKPEEYLL